MKIVSKKFVYPHPVHCHRDMYCDSIGSGENYDRASPQAGAAIAAAMVDGEGVLDDFGKHRWMKAVGKRLLSRVRTKVTLRLVIFPLLVSLSDPDSSRKMKNVCGAFLWGGRALSSCW